MFYGLSQCFLGFSKNFVEVFSRINQVDIGLVFLKTKMLAP